MGYVPTHLDEPVLTIEVVGFRWHGTQWQTAQPNDRCGYLQRDGYLIQGFVTVLKHRKVMGNSTTDMITLYKGMG